MKKLAIPALGCLLGLPAAAEEESEASYEPYPPEQWAMRDVINRVQLSPDGKRLAVMKTPPNDADPLLEIYDAADLSKEPFRMNADPMELISFNWMNDHQVLFSARQLVRDTIRGREQNPYKFRLGLLDIEEKDVSEFGTQGSVRIVSRMPDRPDKVIVAIAPPDQPQVSSELRRILGIIRPFDYYELDLKRGTKKLLVQGKLAFGDYGFDADGELWRAIASDESKRELAWMWRPTPDAKWQEIHRVHADEWEFQPFNIWAKDDAKPGHALVTARNGHDTLGLWSYDMANKRFAEAIYRRGDVDVLGVWLHSNTWTHPDTVVGVVYYTDKRHVEFFDGREEALQRQLEGVIPYAHEVAVSTSRDGSAMVIYNSGPRDPGTYYLFRNGELSTIGSRQPLFDSERLADVEYVHYAARDGYRIPAYLTIPKGEPPFPLVVMPHGGPAGRDFGGYDKWAQLLANNGYLVVQPQFRGGVGDGLAHRMVVFEDGGQEGRKMQDDKDDAALYLVKRGLADEDRMAMFGWSYGGYAAGVAASRTPQIYQCVVAGAAVLDPRRQSNWELSRMVGETHRRYEALTDTAVSPMEEVENVNVPMLLIHGVLDLRVLVEQSRRYVKQLEEHEKPYKYVELSGAGHFYNTLRENHQAEFFTAMIDFLANDCGPGGL